MAGVWQDYIKDSGKSQVEMSNRQVVLDLENTEAGFLGD